MRSVAVVAIITVLLFAPAHAFGGEPTPKPACPSLDGEWAGDFDGTFTGLWRATFTQTGETVRASADITVDSARTLAAEGGAGITCEGGKTAIAGSGSARDRSGSFSGLSDETGKKLSGTWWSGDLFGTWRGERAATSEP